MSVPILVAVLVVVGILAVGAVMTKIGDWYRDLGKPSWTPPNWAFGPAWTVILGLAGWAGVLAWTRAPDAAHGRILALFAINIAFQLGWSPLFFNLRRPDWALIEVAGLWASILALILCLAPLSPLAPWLLAPYLAWVTFAGVLNLVIVRMNPPFGKAAPA